MTSARLRLPTVIVAAASAAAAALGCTDNHAVSPWGDAGRPRLADYAVRPDLEAHLAEIADETQRIGLHESFRVEAHDPVSGDPLVAMAYVGHDDVGRPLTATRIASPWGVVLARGPLDLRDVRRTSATELLRLVAIEAADGASGDPAPGGGFGAFSDLTHDGMPDVVLRSERGRLEIWGVTSRGGTQLNVVLEVTPTRLVDVDGDGRVDLAGAVELAEGDPLAPAFVDVATWAGDGYSDATPEARDFHAKRRDLARGAEATTRVEAVRVRRALEHAWHAILAGGDVEREIAALARKRPEGALREAFDAHARRISRIGR